MVVREKEIINMSCTLFYRITLKKNKSLDWQLRNCLQKYCSFPRIFDISDHAYITGLVHAEIPDADKLLRLIEDNEEVELDIEC